MSNRVDPSTLSEIQTQTSKIRNFCILAHVDHGKTTLSDSLVSANGIISAKLAGKLRFLDSSEEEQKRGITMHSSAISLLFDLEDRKKTSESDAALTRDEYLINLVDCPGHIDFSSDVSTATRLCDGALIVIDVLEGICTQTHAVLYKALKERMRPCLVLNKIDRLLIDMRLSTVEAFQHLRRLVENVNALAFTLLNSEILKRNEALDKPVVVLAEGEEEEDDPLAIEWTFSPEKGNVVFTGALDCWGFGIAKFANLWAKELGVNKNVLRKYLFEDYSFNTITKKIVKCDPLDSQSSRPMFASMVLDPIWKIYELAIINQSPEKAAKMALNKLKVEIPPREINPRDPRATVQSIFRRWLPLSDAILRMVVRNMPSPIEAQHNRLFTLLPNVSEVQDNGEEEEVEVNVEDVQVTLSPVEKSLSVIEASVSKCSNGVEDPLVVFVSKMMPVRVAELSPRDISLLNERIKRKALAAALHEGEEVDTSLLALQPENEIFMALARVYSGVLRRDSDVYVIGHRHDPLVKDESRSDEYSVDEIHGDVPSGMSGVVTRIPRGSVGMYIMLGPSVFPVEEVTAGNIVGIIGLDDVVLKTATLCNTWAAHPMKAITFQAKPMVQVAIEPVSYADLKKLDAGLQSLYQYDPVVEVGVDESGQHTLVCLGELHLEQCVKSLTERFAKCEVKVSEPLIAFRETVLQCESSSYQPTLSPPWSDMTGLSDCAGGVARLSLGTENLAITFKCVPLPELLVKVLEDDPTAVTAVDVALVEQQRRFATNDQPPPHSHQEEHVFWDAFKSALDTCLSESTSLDTGLQAILGDTKEVSLPDIIGRILSVGPRNGTNALLLNSNVCMDVFDTKVSKVNKTSKAIASISEDSSTEGALVGSISLKNHSLLFHKVWSRLNSSVIAGFQVAVAKGPLMHEPLHGVAFVIEKIELNLATCSLSLSSSEISSFLNSSDSLETLETNSSSGLLVTGQLISEVKETLWFAMLSCPVRLVEPIYQCDLQCDQSQLGNLYGVLSKRRGEVTKEDIIEGTSLFLLSAHLPVVNSFGFAQELLKKTSGSGTAPQLSFAKWQTNALDPFWRPKTEDELEEFGEAGVSEHNLPRTFIDKVRKRKGLPIEEKIVVFGEKQRTMSKKK